MQWVGPSRTHGRGAPAHNSGEAVKMKFRTLIAGAFASALTFASAHANPVDVTYTVSGSAGDWTLDFSFTNNLGGTNGIYFVGVNLPPTENIVGSPTGWGYWGAPWTLSPSGTIYNDPWCVGGPPGFGGCGSAGALTFSIFAGQTLSGFDVVDTALMAPSDVQFFAVTVHGSLGNVEFEGTAVSSATPLPAALPLFASGLGGLGLIGWHRKRKAQAV